MELSHLSTRNKSSITLKNKPNLIKEFQKVAKQIFTPTSRRKILKNTAIPQTTRANDSKSNENFIQNSKIANSLSKKSTIKLLDKLSLKDLSPRLNKKHVESSMALPKKAELSIKSQLSPQSSLKLFNRNPKGVTYNLKRSYFTLPESKKCETRAKAVKKSITELCFRSRIGTIDGSPKPQNQDEYLIIKKYALF